MQATDAGPCVSEARKLPRCLVGGVRISLHLPLLAVHEAYLFPSGREEGPAAGWDAASQCAGKRCEPEIEQREE